MTFVDITMQLSDDYQMHTPTGVQDVQFGLEVIKPHSSPGAGQIVRAMHMRLHHGTHVDAPEHFVEGGAQMSDLPLERFVGPAVVADLSGVGRDAGITVAQLRDAIPSSRQTGDRLLIRTDWTDHYGEADYVDGSPYLTVDAVKWCVEEGFPLVGLDFAHTKDDPEAPYRFFITRHFCENDVVTMGYVRNLKAVPSSRVELIALPLSVAGAEASPVRAVVREL